MSAGTCGASNSPSSTFALSSSCAVVCATNYKSTVSTVSCGPSSGVLIPTWMCFTGRPLLVPDMVAIACDGTLRVLVFVSPQLASLASGCYFSTPLPANTVTTPLTCGAYAAPANTIPRSTSCAVVCATAYASTVSAVACGTSTAMLTPTWTCFTGAQCCP